MKRYISNSIDIYMLITNENEHYYVCGMMLFPKKDVIVDYYPLDDLNGRLHVHTVPFINY